MFAIDKDAFFSEEKAKKERIKRKKESFALLQEMAEKL